MAGTRFSGYKRCKWMAIVSAVFVVLAIGFMIPGAIGIAGLNMYNDTLLYLGLIDLIFAGIFFISWCTCQISADDVTYFERDIKIQVKPMRLDSASSSDSELENGFHGLLTDHPGVIEES